MMTDEELREKALMLAIQALGKEPYAGIGRVLMAAQDFEKFLRGVRG